MMMDAQDHAAQLRQRVSALSRERRAVLAASLAKHREAGATGEKHLVAYLVERPGADLTVEELRGFLAGRLPSYMVPAAFVTLPALPRTPAGKIDRATLPEPGRSRPGLSEIYVAPRTPLEAALAEIWSEILDLDEVGVNDNFFDLGGDSMLSLRISAQARAMGIELGPHDLFEQQTIAGTAARVATARSEGR